MSVWDEEEEPGAIVSKASNNRPAPAPVPAPAPPPRLVLEQEDVQTMLTMLQKPADKGEDEDEPGAIKPGTSKPTPTAKKPIFTAPKRASTKRWPPPKPKQATEASPWLVGTAAPAKRAPTTPSPTISFSTASTAARAVPKWRTGRPNSSAATGFRKNLAKNTAGQPRLSNTDQLKFQKQNWNTRKLPTGKVSDLAGTYTVLLHVPTREEEARPERLVHTKHVNLALRKRRQEERKAAEKERARKLNDEIRKKRSLWLPMAIKIQAQVRRRRAQRLAEKKRRDLVLSRAAVPIQALARTNLAKKEAVRLRAEAEQRRIAEAERRAAVRLQAFFRAALTRGRVAVLVDRLIGEWEELEAEARATAAAHGLVAPPPTAQPIAAA